MATIPGLLTRSREKIETTMAQKSCPIVILRKKRANGNYGNTNEYSNLDKSLNAKSRGEREREFERI